MDIFLASVVGVLGSESELFVIKKANGGSFTESLGLEVPSLTR